MRTYSIDDGAESVLASARRHGLKVLHGVWLSNKPDKNRRQIATTAALAKEYADVISAVIVGNEVLLRGEMSATDLMAAIREVKAQVAKPVTYADVWEYWLRYADVRNAVDFVTIHILPYWEDFPIPASRCGRPRRRDPRSGSRPPFPARTSSSANSAGRARGACASARGLRPGTRRASSAKRWRSPSASTSRSISSRRSISPGSVRSKGRSAAIGAFSTARPAGSNSASAARFPSIRIGLGRRLAGIALAALSFAGAFAAGRGKGFSAYLWPGVAALSFLPAVLFGWTIETVPVESFSVGSWLRSLAFAATAGAAPVVCAMACAAGRAVPAFSSLLGRGGKRPDGLDWALGGTLIALMLVSIEAALGLVFDPRYRDIAFAPLTAAALPFLVVLVSTPRPAGARATAETVAAAVLALSGGYILFNEGFANWQSVWFCAGLFGLAFILASGAGRAKLRMRTPAASADRSALCSTTPKARRRQRDGNEHQRRPHEIEQGGDQRGAAEHLMIEEHDGQPKRPAQPGIEPGLAGERHGAVLDREVAQIEGLPHGQEADHQQPVQLACGRPEQRTGLVDGGHADAS